MSVILLSDPRGAVEARGTVEATARSVADRDLRTIPNILKRLDRHHNLPGNYSPFQPG